MTSALAERFDRVLALDVSPAMIDHARSAVSRPNVEFHVVSGDRLDGIDDAIADVLVCYLVLQHLPSRDAVLGYLVEFARVLAPHGDAFVQLPVMGGGIAARTWRAFRSAAIPAVAVIGPRYRREFRGYRLTRAELDAGLDRGGLRVVATDVGPDAPYRYSRDLFLRLTR